MSDGTPAHDGRPATRAAYSAESQPELFDGILSKRIVAYLVDAVLIKKSQNFDRIVSGLFPEIAVKTLKKTDRFRTPE